MTITKLQDSAKKKSKNKLLLKKEIENLLLFLYAGKKMLQSNQVCQFPKSTLHTNDSPVFSIRSAYNEIKYHHKRESIHDNILSIESANRSDLNQSADSTESFFMQTKC